MLNPAMIATFAALCNVYIMTPMIPKNITKDQCIRALDNCVYEKNLELFADGRSDIYNPDTELETISDCDWELTKAKRIYHYINL